MAAGCAVMGALAFDLSSLEVDEKTRIRLTKYSQKAG